MYITMWGFLTGSAAIFEMDAAMCRRNPSIFVLTKSHVNYVCSLLNENEMKFFLILNYSNGYLILLQDHAVMITTSLLLENKRIFHQKFC